MNILRRSLTVLKFSLLQKSTLYYVPQRYVLQNAKRLRSKPKIHEFEPPKIDKQKFEEEANLLVYKLKQAFEELKQDDPRVGGIYLSETQPDPFDDSVLFSKVLIVKIDHVGEYEFKINEREQLFYMSSPDAGISKYYYEEGNERWVSNRDKHIFEDLLVREVTKKCKSFLKL